MGHKMNLLTDVCRRGVCFYLLSLFRLVFDEELRLAHHRKPGDPDPDEDKEDKDGKKKKKKKKK